MMVRAAEEGTELVWVHHHSESCKKGEKSEQSALDLGGKAHGPHIIC